MFSIEPDKGEQHMEMINLITVTASNDGQQSDFDQHIFNCSRIIAFLLFYYPV